jgi:hypothetical protein
MAGQKLLPGLSHVMVNVLANGVYDAAKEIIKIILRASIGL